MYYSNHLDLNFSLTEKFGSYRRTTSPCIILVCRSFWMISFHASLVGRWLVIGLIARFIKLIEMNTTFLSHFQQVQVWLLDYPIWYVFLLLLCKRMTWFFKKKISRYIYWSYPRPFGIEGVMKMSHSNLYSPSSVALAWFLY